MHLEKHIMWERSRDGFVPYESYVVVDTSQFR